MKIQFQMRVTPLKILIELNGTLHRSSYRKIRRDEAKGVQRYR